MNKRKLFSDADGTKIGEDLKDIFNELKTKLFDFVRKYGHLAEKIIEFLKLVDEQIKEGTPTDKVIDAVLAKIPGSADEKIYKFIQDHLGGWIENAEQYLEHLQIFESDGEIDLVASITADYESARHKRASITLEDYLKEQGEEISRADSDTCIQVVYWLDKNS